MTTLPTTSSSEISNVTEIRVIPREDLDLDEIQYFTHNGWKSHKTKYHPGHYVLIRKNAPLEDFMLYNTAKEWEDES